MHYLALSFDSPELIVWSVCIGFILGIVATFLVKQVLGKFISLILDTGANNESSAVSLNDIGQGSNKLLKVCLKVIGVGGVVSFVSDTGDDVKSENHSNSVKINKSKALDLEKVKFYIEDGKVEKLYLHCEECGATTEVVFE